MTEATSEPDKKTIGSLLKASPPLMGYSQVVRDLVTQMSPFGFGGNLKIAQTLARAGVKLSKETVRRWCNNPKPPCPPKDLPAEPQPAGPALRAKRPNHIWMIDITEIPGLLALFSFKLAVVIDVFSRMPILGQIFTKNPTADEMASLVGSAAKRVGPSSHFVNDQGTQFTAAEFRAKLKELGAKQRFGAIGKSGSIAIIERLWRTVKETFGLKLQPPLSPAALQGRLVIGLYHYAYHRPHQGLGGATPAEIYYGKTPAHLDAVRPARAYEKRSDDKLFEIAYLDPEKYLGVLIPKAA